MISLKNVLYALLSRTHLDDILDAMSFEESSSEDELMHIPELDGKMLYFEAERLGLERSKFSDEELRKIIIKELCSNKR